MAGEWDVDGLESRMSVATLARWFAYYQIAPWGDEWRQAARMSSIVCAANGIKVKDDFEDRFMPGGGRYRGMSQTEIEMLQELKKIPQMREQFEKRK